MTLKIGATDQDQSWRELLDRAVNVQGYNSKVKVAYDPSHSSVSGVWHYYKPEQVTTGKDVTAIYVIGPNEDGTDFPFAKKNLTHRAFREKVNQIKKHAKEEYDWKIEQLRANEKNDAERLQIELLERQERQREQDKCIESTLKKLDEDLFRMQISREHDRNYPYGLGDI